MAMMSSAYGKGGEQLPELINFSMRAFGRLCFPAPRQGFLGSGSPNLFIFQCGLLGGFVFRRRVKVF